MEFTVVSEIILRHGKMGKFVSYHFQDFKSKKISNDQELIQSDPISCPQNQKGKN